MVTFVFSLLTVIITAGYHLFAKLIGRPALFISVAYMIIDAYIFHIQDEQLVNGIYLVVVILIAVHIIYLLYRYGLIATVSFYNLCAFPIIILLYMIHTVSLPWLVVSGGILIITAFINHATECSVFFDQPRKGYTARKEESERRKASKKASKNYCDEKLAGLDSVSTHDLMHY